MCVMKNNGVFIFFNVSTPQKINKLPYLCIYDTTNHLQSPGTRNDGWDAWCLRQLFSAWRNPVKTECTWICAYFGGTWRYSSSCKVNIEWRQLHCSHHKRPTESRHLAGHLLLWVPKWCHYKKDRFVKFLVKRLPISKFTFRIQSTIWKK